MAQRLQYRSIALLALILTLNAVAGFYRPRLELSVLDEVPGLLGRALAAGAIVVSLVLAADTPVGRTLLHTSAAFAAFAICGRGVLYAVVRRLRRAGLSHPALIFGAGRVGGEIAKTLLEHPEYGLQPIGFLDDDPLLAPDDRPVPVLGGTDALAQVLTERGVRHVVVAFGSTREDSLVHTLRTCDRLACEIFFVPRLFEMQSGGRDIDLIWSLPLVRLRRAAFRTHGWRLKRLFDVISAGAALVLLSPLLLVCSLLVRVFIGRPVLFRQSRVGLDGRPFKLLKFRSLTPVDESEGSSRWNIADDARMTPVGRFLRRASLDELPQLWNILRGDMSVVGPRPERPFFVEQFTAKFPRYMARHRVPAGLTGWAQVHGLRGDTSIADRATFDNYYIENWSLWEDVKIILRTFSQVLTAGGR